MKFKPNDILVVEVVDLDLCKLSEANAKERSRTEHAMYSMCDVFERPPLKFNGVSRFFLEVLVVVEKGQTHKEKNASGYICTTPKGAGMTFPFVWDERHFSLSSLTDYEYFKLHDENRKEAKAHE